MKLPTNLETAIQSFGLDVAVKVTNDFAVQQYVDCPFCGRRISKTPTSNVAQLYAHMEGCRYQKLKFQVTREWRRACGHWHQHASNLPRENIAKLNEARAKLKDKLYTCKYCGKEGFKGPFAIGNHHRTCKKNPCRNETAIKEHCAKLRAMKSGQHRMLKDLLKEDELDNILIQDNNGVVSEI